MDLSCNVYWGGDQVPLRICSVDKYKRSKFKIIVWSGSWKPIKGAENILKKAQMQNWTMISMKDDFSKYVSS